MNAKPGTVAALDREDAAVAGHRAEPVARRRQVGQAAPVPVARVVSSTSRIVPADSSPPTTTIGRRRGRGDPPARLAHRGLATPAARARVVGLDDGVVALAGRPAGERVEATAGDGGGEVLARDRHVGSGAPAPRAEVVDLERRERPSVVGSADRVQAVADHADRERAAAVGADGSRVQRSRPGS